MYGKSGARHYPTGTGQPFCLAGVSVVDCIQNEFHATGDAELFEYPEEIFFDGVLAEIEFARNIAVAKAFGDEGDDLFFPRSEQIVSIRVEHSQGRHFRDEFHDVVELLRIRPDLAVGNPEQAFTQQAQVRVRDAEYAAYAGPKCVYDKFTVEGF